MSTSPDDERLENSINDNICENIKPLGDDSKSTCLPLNSDELCGKLNNSISKDSIPTQNDNQDKIVSNDIIESEVKIGNDIQVDTDKVDCMVDNSSVNKDDTPSKINLNGEELSILSKDELAQCWLQQNKYISYLVSKLEVNSNEEIKTLRMNEEKLKTQLAEMQKKEQYHAMRLTTKEHELQELGMQIDELKACMGGASLKYCMLDPATNLLFERMKRDLDLTKTKMDETQNELAAWKFTPDSNTGKQLMAKCRLLIKENEELGKMISSGRLSKLEGDLALQKSFSDEFKKSQLEVDEFLQEMDEDTEGMQGTILYLQSELRDAKERIAQLNGQMSDVQPLAQNGRSEIAEVTNGGGSDGDDNVSWTEKDGGVSCKRTRSELSDEFDSNDMCVAYKKERTKSPLMENGV